MAPSMLSKSKRVEKQETNWVPAKTPCIPSYKKITPLRGLDLFAGCGGLSKGLEDSGLLKSKWAIESDAKAAASFKLNNPDTIVLIEDCDRLLKLAKLGVTKNKKNQRIPQRGEVDFICGGPSWVEFSDTNLSNTNQLSKMFRNSQIFTFLSYIEYYRPKFFIMENNRNFASFNSSMILKFTLSCTMRIGYQCTFRILQAGNFGVPQNKKFLFIMAAAPDETLPFYPEPIHVCNTSSLAVRIDEKQYRTNYSYKNTASLRSVPVYDAWSDLPHITSEVSSETMPYNNDPITHFQRLMRYSNNFPAESILTNHICKKITPLVQARMELIPINEGSDWRDLPNKEVLLSDGTNVLNYTHHDIQNGLSSDGEVRGVCQCASGMICNPKDCQLNTIIPWSLVHTANKNNYWAGLYGRLSWTGFCSSIISPEPIGIEGKVLHPEQHCVISVRECARLQGFNDSFLFYGPTNSKYWQIDNAVPPPMGKAIGHEVIKAIAKKVRQ